jgi:hypothetical protein
MNLDTLPNLSRDTVIFPTGNTLVEEDLAALFIGGSNADRLANSAATLGIVSETITTAGWILSTDAVTAILPQVIEYCNSLPEEAPVVIYCLDNSSFCSANKDGQLSSITKLKDGLYHVPGELVVVHEVTLAAAVTNLKRILVACGNRRVLIITPWAQVPHSAMLLQGGPLHTPPGSGFRPQAHAGSGETAAVHLAEAGRERQLHCHPCLRPPLW